MVPRTSAAPNRPGILSIDSNTQGLARCGEGQVPRPEGRIVRIEGHELRYAGRRGQCAKGFQRALDPSGQDRHRLGPRGMGRNLGLSCVGRRHDPIRARPDAAGSRCPKSPECAGPAAADGRSRPPRPGSCGCRCARYRDVGCAGANDRPTPASTVCPALAIRPAIAAAMVPVPMMLIVLMFNLLKIAMLWDRNGRSPSDENVHDTAPCGRCERWWYGRLHPSNLTRSLKIS